MNWSPTEFNDLDSGDNHLKVRRKQAVWSISHRQRWLVRRTLIRMGAVVSRNVLNEHDSLKVMPHTS